MVDGGWWCGRYGRYRFVSGRWYGGGARDGGMAGRDTDFLAFEWLRDSITDSYVIVIYFAKIKFQHFFGGGKLVSVKLYELRHMWIHNTSLHRNTFYKKGRISMRNAH